MHGVGYTALPPPALCSPRGGSSGMALDVPCLPQPPTPTNVSDCIDPDACSAVGAGTLWGQHELQFSRTRSYRPRRRKGPASRPSVTSC